jgi:hypothetical protein
MSFWIREIVGWFLMAVGLFAYLICYGFFLVADRVVAAGILAGIATMIFRGGLHLVKVATAARVVLHARQQRDRADRIEHVEMARLA